MSKTLVAYFSASGVTAKLAKTLADKTACQKIMESPQAQALIRKFTGK